MFVTEPGIEEICLVRGNVKKATIMRNLWVIGIWETLTKPSAHDSFCTELTPSFCLIKTIAMEYFTNIYQQRSPVNVIEARGERKERGSTILSSVGVAAVSDASRGSGILR